MFLLTYFSFNRIFSHFTFQTINVLHFGYQRKVLFIIVSRLITKDKINKRKEILNKLS